MKVRVSLVQELKDIYTLLKDVSGIKYQGLVFHYLGGQIIIEEMENEVARFDYKKEKNQFANWFIAKFN